MHPTSASCSTRSSKNEAALASTRYAAQLSVRSRLGFKKNSGISSGASFYLCAVQRYLRPDEAMRAFALPASEMKLADAQNFDTAMRTQFWAACADTHGLSEWRSDAGWKFRCVDKYNASGENIKISRRMTQSPQKENSLSLSFSDRILPLSPPLTGVSARPLRGVGKPTARDASQGL